jgi:hypothetical protein
VESIREFVPGDSDFVSFFTSDITVESAGEMRKKPDEPESPTNNVETPSTSNTIKPTSIESPSTSPTDLAAIHSENGIMENEPVDINKSSYLAKKGKGQNGYTWKKRYFALRNGLMDCLEKA